MSCYDLKYPTNPLVYSKEKELHILFNNGQVSMLGKVYYSTDR